MLKMFFAKFLALWFTIFAVLFTQHEANVFTSKETITKNFPVLSEKLEEVGEQYGYKVNVEEKDMLVLLEKENERVKITIENPCIDKEDTAPEKIYIYYTRYGTRDKSFDLDFFVNLINSISFRKYKKEECQELLFTDADKYKVECDTSVGQVENLKRCFDSFYEDYWLDYECYAEDSSDKREFLYVKTLSNS